MILFPRVINFFKINVSAKELNRERHKALMQQVPMMYFILVANMFTLVWPHMHHAPMLLTLGVPIILTLFFIVRSYPMVMKIGKKVSYDQVVKDLNSTTPRAAILGVIFIIWAYFLFQYGMPIMKIHITFFLYFSLICCSFFLMQMLQSVVTLLIVILLPSVIYLATSDVMVFKSVAMNITLVSLGIIYLLFCQFQNFKNLIRQRSVLSRSKAAIADQADKLQTMNIELELTNVRNFKLANLDTLTNLPNRRSFFTQLDQLIEKHDKLDKKKLIVGLLDLDGFKRINDVFGHPAGDCLLIKASERLSDVLGEDIILARLGGDEFGIILTSPDDIENVLEIGAQICDAMRQGFHLKEASVQIGTTVGFVEYPSMASSSQLLFERADYALCYSKQNSKGSPVLFSTKHETIIKDVAEIEQTLNNADLEAELEIVFQPIIDVSNTRTVGFEALARWNSPTLGKVRPDIFIGAAEQMGIIGKLTTVLLEKALKAACEWPKDIYLSFNLSIFDLSSDATILKIVSLVQSSDFPNKLIVFEVTETAVMNDFQQANESLKMLKLLGAKIALDDFGTGYSSLSYVQCMPLDRLKIDRSFITNITTESNSRNIVQTILDLCNNLNLYCIVEGVETSEQLEILKSMGCDYIQGFYFSRPLNHQATIEFANRNENLPKAESLQEQWSRL